MDKLEDLFENAVQGKPYNVDNTKNELYLEEIPKKAKYTIRMDITMDREMSYEEAERLFFSALRSVGMKAHCGGIS